MLVQLAVCIYSMAWPWVLSKTTWGKLMADYAVGLDKIDIARGRSVPAPPYGRHPTSTLKANLSSISVYVV